MKLYYFAPSHHSRRVLAVINQLGLEVVLDHRDLTKGEHKTPEIEALNPNGFLPILTDGDLRLYESNAIMQYLANQQAETDLYPREAAARALVDQWLSWQMCHFGPATTIFVFENMVKQLIGGGPADPVKIAEGKEKFAKFGAVLDARLAESRFIAGDAVTLADYAIASNLMYADAAGIPWGELNNVKAWYARIEELPAWQKSAPPQM